VASLVNLTLPDDATYESLTPQQKLFIDWYLRGYDAEAAARKAGYTDAPQGSPSHHRIPFKARKLEQTLRPIIERRVEVYARGADMARLGLKVLRELAEHSESDTVRLQAAKEILSRSLEGKTSKTEVKHTHTHAVKHLSDTDLDKRIAQLRKELGVGEVIDVTPKEAADD